MPTKKNQKSYYSGKKKRHTLKSQIIVDQKSKRIISTAFASGKKHDLRLFKESGNYIHKDILTLIDTGYIGIDKIHAHSILPAKKSKNRPLTNEDKKWNREISSVRVLCENVIGMLKRYKILSERYRNQRKRFDLRFNLIAGFYNYELVP